MINLIKAKQAFKEYVHHFDINQGKIEMKIHHTYRVQESSEDIAKKLGLEEEDIKLASLIGLLHDIGRFEQVAKYNTFVDTKQTDHAIEGIKVLFEQKLIRNFIEQDDYDKIIEKAILNHNRLEIEDGLDERELLHAKIIRDADKIDIFYSVTREKIEVLFNTPDISREKITDMVYQECMKGRCINSKDRITHMDTWVSFIAFLYNFYYIHGLQIIKEKGYINSIIDRIDYKEEETKQRMENIRQYANTYIEERIKNNE